MKSIHIGMLALLMAVWAASQTYSAGKNTATRSDRERLIGAWRLASMAGLDGKPVATGVPMGMLIYTHDGHMSVQLMYPRSAGALSSEYVQNGYEASFGSYDINAATHTVTHHVRGSNTRDLLVGKDLPRIYQFSADGHLVIKVGPAGRALVSYLGSITDRGSRLRTLKKGDKA